MHAWLIWVIAAAVLAAAESLSLDLVLIMLAGGAGAAAVAAGVGADALVQVVVGVAGAGALLGGVRPIARRHLLAADTTPSGTAALVGMPAVVIEPVDEQDGRVKLNGSVWSAATAHAGPRIAAGTRVRVLEIRGATAIVYEEI